MFLFFFLAMVKPLPSTALMQSNVPRNKLHFLKFIVLQWLVEQFVCIATSPNAVKKNTVPSNWLDSDTFYLCIHNEEVGKLRLHKIIQILNIYTKISQTSVSLIALIKNY